MPTHTSFVLTAAATASVALPCVAITKAKKPQLI
jgi:hypothetical protein